MAIAVDTLEEMSLKIKNARKSLGISQKALAKASGMSQSTIARVETDVRSLNPSYSTMYEIIEALNNYDTEERRAKTSLDARQARELMHKQLVFLGPDDTAEKAMALMKENDFSQIPVVNKKQSVIGTVNQKRLLEVATQLPDRVGQIRVKDLLETSLPQVDKNTPLSKIKPMLESWDAVLVVEESKVIGIITVYDVFRIL